MASFARIAALSLTAPLALAVPASAAAVKTYQVTGPVTEVTDSAITVQKGSEKWQIAKDADTKMTGDVKVGTKVTIEYRMVAATVTSKDQPAAAGSAAPSTAASSSAAAPAAKSTKK